MRLYTWINTKVDYFISSFKPEQIISIKTISTHKNNRGSDHYPIRIEINLENAKSRYIQSVVNKRQLELLTDKVQKALRKSNEDHENIKRRILNIYPKIQAKKSNVK